MNHFYANYDSESGRIVSTLMIIGGKHKNSHSIEVSKTQYPTIKNTHRVDVKTHTLVLGALADSNPPTMKEIRRQRDVELSNAGQRLTEYMLADSFPTLTLTQKKTAIDALVVYRQALRDITTQPDPAKIVWPMLPI